MENYNILREFIDCREAIIVCPEKGKKNGKWVLKTEYFDAFPAVQNELLKRGYHIAYIPNKTRWHHESDDEAKAKLARYMHSDLGLDKKCAVIGMSCGGLQGIYFAAKYPEYVACMYLDAPVINFLSCPAGLGKATDEEWEEFKEHTGMDLTALLSYRNHPLDNIPKLIENNIPIILINGDEDISVPYEENGKTLNDMYKQNNCIIQTIIKKGAGHHPHGLDDNTPIVDFIEKYYF